MAHRPLGAYLSPIHRLPVELLSYIFALGTHDADIDREEAGDAVCPAFDAETVKTPLVLSRVSRHWRTVARGTPALWTSICVTAGLVESGLGPTSSWLNTDHLTAYVALSRNYPLDILIDARDEEWDFSEPEIYCSSDCDTYVPPFSSTHMNAAVSLLLPHISRWRSLSILTDAWAPMYTALQQIQTSITTLGAPRLESLTLMRCNDYVSFPLAFQPHNMKDPAFLKLNETSILPQNILPRLRHLALRGVHVDWASLSTILSSSQPGLDTLDLASHCPDVRPSLHEFRQLLSACPRLTKLSISGSGACIPENIEEGASVMTDGLKPTSLPYLRDMAIGYRSVAEGQATLELLDAPNARVLTLEDASHPGALEEVDAGSMFMYMSTGELPTPDDDEEQDFVFAYVTPDGHQHLKPHHPFAVPRRTKDGEHTEQQSPSRAPKFPLLENVTLRGVRSCPIPLHAFFAALPHLHSLEFNDMPTHAIWALGPPQPTTAAMPCPCPRLESLCIRGFEHRQLQDIVLRVAALSLNRLNRGACGLREVDIHIGGTDSPEPGHVTEDVVRVSNVPGTTLRIIREAVRADEEPADDEESDFGLYEVGGAFNDPIFDARYAGRAMLSL